MKIKENVTLYICSHCGKRLLKKKAMELHEPACYSNPENFRACSSCDFLKETENTVYFDTWNGEGSRKFRAFRCDKLDKMLYPYKVEKNGLLNRFPESFEDQEPMPKNCEFYTHCGTLIGDLTDKDLFGNKIKNHG